MFPLIEAIERFARRIGYVICWANALLILAIIVQVVLRYGFGRGQIFLEELQWHLFALAMLFGISFTQAANNHIRVDIFAARFSENAKRRWEIFGILAFILPFAWVVFYHSLDFVAESWRLGERSNAPSGLPWRWAIKLMIPLGFGLLGLVALAQLARDIALSMGKDRKQ
uniref:TRAP transporter small permease protein n=2 Tax=unclassified Candidatus Kentrum TaxID=2643149 RepID=A0A451AZ07_9GAMM|nr:MAG: TRAP-type mannitol/chloroaromatic compound transport system, small permease component [Candidatus Kentron sp. LPFa]VFK15586.1 MAG: TRAP-type mannitol/chloroaromatic compound transport system, small permease component [Candidatus Kentron sp. LPFa]VFK30900.1 MAG: TRAP-type mannitol/chloroaromatic compound transport system, small permease component [Candidatus Kentron sp. LPFa]VFK64848.1 MAG: TRAP-type mannitol/chloroaromatic compound transport system, small permease component [Candidatus K